VTAPVRHWWRICCTCALAASYLARQNLPKALSTLTGAF
jgi:hypothetical protein